MNKKLLFIGVALLTVTALSACKGNNKKSNSSGDDYRPYEDGERKNYKGTGAIFEEVLGYNTKDAAIFQDGEERYIIYASNEEAQGDQVFAARKATKVEGKWVYQKKNIILKGSEGWDKNIFNPSIVKGEFTYGGTKYSYLMAYNGNDNKNGTNNHIGLAVSNDVLSGWVRVGTKPILENPSIYEACYGFGSPSLISYDQKGKGYLFYAVGEKEVSFSAVKTYDFSNLDSLLLEPGYFSLPITGLTDKVEGDAIIMNAGFALSSNGESLYMVRDRLPQSANKPNQTTEVEIDKANLSITQDISESWTVVDNITGMKTMDMDDDESLGWDQIYSGEFVTDPFGKLLSASSGEVIYSTYDEEANAPMYSAILATYEVSL